MEDIMKNILSILFLGFLVSCTDPISNSKNTSKEEFIGKLPSAYNLTSLDVGQNKTMSLAGESYVEPRLFFPPVEGAEHL